jgi:hypothetical protein
MELTCYTIDGWETRIRPASPKRNWMEQSQDLFAYRCLPLAIANSHGWEVLSPCGFEARWRGGNLPEAVEIRLDARANPEHAPRAYFGSATMTFHTGGLFRTPPGWNMWVGGPPNEAKDGIAPLSGIVETDWSPYTFTMNWRFTRQDHWVRFEENEPIAFLFPVQRGAAESFDPVIRRMEDEPELFADYMKWSQSRDSFIHWAKETRPQVRSKQWQKLYYRGVDVHGNAGPDDHEAKLRLKPFHEPEGRNVPMPEARRCPADPGRTLRPVTPPKASVDQFTLGAPVLGSFAPPKKP